MMMGIRQPGIEIPGDRLCALRATNCTGSNVRAAAAVRDASTGGQVVDRPWRPRQWHPPATPSRRGSDWARGEHGEP